MSRLKQILTELNLMNRKDDVLVGLNDQFTGKEIKINTKLGANEIEYIRTKYLVTQNIHLQPSDEKQLTINKDDINTYLNLISRVKDSNVFGKAKDIARKILPINDNQYRSLFEKFYLLNYIKFEDELRKTFTLNAPYWTKETYNDRNSERYQLNGILRPNEDASILNIYKKLKINEKLDINLIPIYKSFKQKNNFEYNFPVTYQSTKKELPLKFNEEYDRPIYEYSLFLMNLNAMLSEIEVQNNEKYYEEKLKIILKTGKLKQIEGSLFLDEHQISLNAKVYAYRSETRDFTARFNIHKGLKDITEISLYSVKEPIDEFFNQYKLYHIILEPCENEIKFYRTSNYYDLWYIKMMYLNKIGADLSESYLYDKQLTTLAVRKSTGLPIEVERLLISISGKLPKQVLYPYYMEKKDTYYQKDTMLLYPNITQEHIDLISDLLTYIDINPHQFGRKI